MSGPRPDPALWSQASFYGDPVPGDPDLVNEHVSNFRRTAETCGQVATKLRSLRSADNNISEAVTKILGRADSTAQGMDSAKLRYESMARGLAAYSPILAGAQTKSAAALTDCLAAAAAQKAAASAQAKAKQRLNDVDDATRKQASEDVVTHGAAAERQQTAYNEARGRILQAISERDAGATAAASQINMDLERDPLQDSFWDKLVNFVTSIATWVWENIDTICLVLDLLAIVLALTGVGGPIAAVLMMVSKAAKLLSTIKTVVTIYQAASEGDWGKVALIGGSYLLGKGLSAGSSKLVSKFGAKYASSAASSVTAGQPAWASRAISGFNTVAGQKVGQVAGPITSTALGSKATAFVGSHLALESLPKAMKSTVESWAGDAVTLGVDLTVDGMQTTATERVLARAA